MFFYIINKHIATTSFTVSVFVRAHVLSIILLLRHSTYQVVIFVARLPYSTRAIIYPFPASFSFLLHLTPFHSVLLFPVPPLHLPPYFGFPNFFTLFNHHIFANLSHPCNLFLLLARIPHLCDPFLLPVNLPHSCCLFLRLQKQLPCLNPTTTGNSLCLPHFQRHLRRFVCFLASLYSI